MQAYLEHVLFIFYVLIFYRLFNHAVSSSVYTASNDGMANE
jgi:hypothetical protein